MRRVNDADDRLPPQVFARLPAGTRAGHVVELDGWPGQWRVITAKVANDGRDVKCTLQPEPEDAA